MEVLAVIPARGGSKRIPRKNMKQLGGKPLLAWTVEAAEQSDMVTRVVVSSEDDEILGWCEAHGVESLRRAPYLAGDDVISAPVVLDVLQRLETFDGYSPRYVCLLHPTSPFRRSDHIDEAVGLCMTMKGVNVITVTRDELNGAIYVSNAERFKRARSFFAPLVWPLELDERAGLDIDTLDDWARGAELVSTWCGPPSGNTEDPGSTPGASI